MERKVWSKPLRLAGELVLVAIGGALLTVLALLLFYRMGGLAGVSPPLVLQGADLQLASGQGEQTPTGLIIRQAGPQGVAAVQGAARMVRAALYRQVYWQVEGLDPRSELRLMWVSANEPRTLREISLPSAGRASSAFDLSQEPHWQNRIMAIGLAVRGPLPQPLVINRLELRPVALTVAELWNLAIAEWTVFEDWSQRSINYTAGAPLDALFPPVLVIALWIGFGSALYFMLFGLPLHSTGRLLPYAMLFLLGWLVVDVRWQWDLSRRLERTAEHFAGKEGDERRLAAADGELYRFLLEVRQRLPAQPTRLFILSANPGDSTTYQAGRARYHLLPHNGYAGFSRPPGAARAGDYLLILSPLPGVRFNRERQALEWEDGQQLPAEMLYAAALGALFRVRGG